ncbi:MAG TPA: hypothetical protein DCR14_06305, partial [Acidimicrobiaceae bacterium]|nr:hypothetical protein [Acidimicrobiaceae bacterium]
FTYTVSDGQEASNTATVTITVTPDTNVAPVAVNDAYTVAEGGTLNVPAPGLLDNDTDPEGDTLTPTISDLPAHGILSPAADGSFVYTPASGYFGTDTFTYT